MYTIERLPPLPSTSMRSRVSEICVIECISVMKSGFVVFIVGDLWFAGLCYWCALCMFVWGLMCLCVCVVVCDCVVVDLWACLCVGFYVSVLRALVCVCVFMWSRICGFVCVCVCLCVCLWVC
jgi:hypothetical protein